MAVTADRLQMNTVLVAVTEMILQTLDLNVCCEALVFCNDSRLPAVEREARNVAMGRFEEFAGTPGFLHLSQGALESILDDDYLVASSEERVFEAAQRWRNRALDGAGCIEADLRVLRHVRLPLIDAAYLRSAAEAQPRGSSVRAMLLEALRVKSLPAATREGAAALRLGARSIEPRVGSEEEWARFLRLGAGAPGSLGGSGRRIIRCADDPSCLTVHEGRVYCGTRSGTVIVWRRTTLLEERRLVGPTGSAWPGALSLAGWRRLLLVEYESVVWSWDLRSGTRQRAFPKTPGGRIGLVVVGSALAMCGRDGGRVRIWCIESGSMLAAWTKGSDPEPDSEICWGGHFGVVAWGRRVAFGGMDRTVEVRDAVTGALWARLSADGGAGAGPTGERSGGDSEGLGSRAKWGLFEQARIVALAAEGRRLYAACGDGSMAAWADGGSGRPRLEAREGAESTPARVLVDQLLPRGATLIGYCYSKSDPRLNEVREWDAGTLAVLRTLRLHREGQSLRHLSAGPGAEVWASIGGRLVGFKSRDGPKRVAASRGGGGRRGPP